MNKFLAVCFLLFGSVAFAQVPNCQINFGPWTDINQSSPSANLYSQCTYWVLSYQVTGFSAVSLEFDSATGINGAPGTFGAFSGTLVTGSNPSTSVACATPTNCSAVFNGTVGWYRVKLGSHTGNGSIQGTLQGYKTGVILGGQTPPSGSGCPGTLSTPCDVQGLQADAMALAGNPVRVCGSDATNCRTILVDTSGRLINVGASAAGTAVAGNPLLVGVDDGTNAQYSRSASLANFPLATVLTAVNSIGAMIHEKGARWNVASHPATSSQATASIAAEANVRHVVDCISFSAAAGGAVTAGTRFLSLRDGATGAGTILQQFILATPTAAAGGIQEVPATTFCGLNLTGSTNTAMTFEFDAGATNLIESVSISGFNVN